MRDDRREVSPTASFGGQLEESLVPVCVAEVAR